MVKNIFFEAGFVPATSGLPYRCSPYTDLLQSPICQYLLAIILILTTGKPPNKGLDIAQYVEHRIRLPGGRRFEPCFVKKENHFDIIQTMCLACLHCGL